MIKRIPGFILVILLLFSLMQCAKKGMPQGGPEDEEAPKFIRSSPENYTTNFNKDEIRIFFDEYVKLKDPQKQIIISPPMDPKPSILPLGSARKDVKIKIFDTLQENTTYTINFGKSIIDNNEGNPLPYFKYVFSTGDYIDSLAVAGTVDDAVLKAPADFISIFLYEIDSTYSDSAVYKTAPRYVTYTLDSTNTFQLENLKEGKYALLAILDKNDNYLFNPKKEKIGFLDHPITIPTDSSFNLVLFQEELAFQPKRPKQINGQQIMFGYEGVTELDSIQINLLNPKPSGFTSRIVKDVKKDSLYYWYHPKPETDSLSFEIVSPNSRDTLFAKISDLPRDSIKLSTEPSGTLDFNKNFKFKSNTPISSHNPELISVLDKDSLEVAFSTEFNSLNNEVVLKFEKKENDKYYIKALPGAITDLFEGSNDTINKKIATKAFSDYGTLILQLQNVKKFPVIAQLTDTKGDVIEERTSNGQTSFTFKYLKPGKYLIRIIFDDNENGKWDTGDFLKKRHPEKIEYFLDTLDIRANWDWNETFRLKD